MRKASVLICLVGAGLLVGSSASGQVLSDTTKSGAWHPEGNAKPRLTMARPMVDIGESALRGAGACEGIGSFEQAFSNINRFRGNVFRFDTTAILDEFRVELDFAGEVDLFFTIHARSSGTEDPFVRVWPETPDASVLTFGLGQAFYSSGPVLIGGQPLLLQEGMDYAIGVSWGSTVIGYAFEAGSFPQSFSRGQVLGGAAISGAAPPIADSINLNPPPGSGLFTGGAYSSELCFAPDPGACCVDDSCEFITLDDCDLRFGAWTAPGVSCDEVDDCNGLTPGVCCLPSGDCASINEFRCEDLDGTFHADTDCAADPCTPRGACCIAGSCEADLTAMECSMAGGVYQGDGSDCESTVCVRGACCFGDSCVPTTEPQCIDGGGTYLGNLTTCDPNPCNPPVTGACCLGDSCSDVTADECAANGGTYNGDNTDCATLTPACGRGACCTPQGCIDGTSQAFCESDPDSAYRGDGTECATVSPRCEGTCCWGADVCNFGGNPVTPEDCFNLLDGVFLGYGSANDCGNDPSPCESIGQTGACCLGGDACSITTSEACDAIEGNYLGNGSTCDECTGGCVNAADCNDHNPCTDDICAGGTCMNPNNTLSCDDGDFCTVDDVCSGGTCFGGAARVCDDGIDCTTDSCDSDLGACVSEPDHAACDDGVGCTTDVCDRISGCQNTAMDSMCDDMVGCTTDTCDPVSDCQFTPVDAACDDGFSCTTDTCDAINDCQNTPVDAACDDSDVCTIDTCDPESGDPMSGCVYMEDPTCSSTMGGACCLPDGSCQDVADESACVGFVCNVTTNELPECGGACGTTCLGDVNGDGVVSVADRGFISANVGETGDALICQYDLDGNGVINVSDRGFVSANVGICTDLPDYQDGSGMNGGVPDTRFGAAAYQGDGSDCATTSCP